MRRKGRGKAVTVKDKRYGALIALNAALMGVLVLVSLPAGAWAQQGATRGRGNYTMVSDRVQGSSEDAVWIIDAANEEIMALRWDISKQDVQFIGYSPFSMVPDPQAPQTPRTR